MKINKLLVSFERGILVGWWFLDYSVKEGEMRWKESWELKVVIIFLGSLEVRERRVLLKWVRLSIFDYKRVVI